MTSLRAVALACCVLIAGCATLEAGAGSRVPFEPVADLPAGWGDYAPQISGDENCPDVAGDYRMTADIVTTRKGVAQESTSDTFVYFRLFVGPLQGVDGGRKVDDRAPMLSLEQPDADTLVLRARIPDAGKQNSWRFSVESGRLRCSDGFFHLPVEEVTGIIEGATLNYQNNRRFTKLNDGSLVYYEQFGPLKSLLGVGRTFTHRFYRFRPVE